LTPLQQRITPAKLGSPKPAGSIAATLRTTLAKSPSQPKGASPATAGAAASGGPSAELRQIALFIQKWKLEATKAKLLLARLSPARRKWVMTNFPGGQTLDAYIQQSERTNAWANAASTHTASVPAIGTSKPSGLVAGAASRLAAKQPTGLVSGVKRPAPASSVSPGGWDANKRLRPSGPGNGYAAKPAGMTPRSYGQASAYGQAAKFGTAAAKLVGATAGFAPSRPKAMGYGSFGAKAPGAKPGSGYAAVSRPKPGAASDKPGSLIKSLLQRA